MCVCLMPQETRRLYQIPWNYSWLWAIMKVLGTELVSSPRAASALICWAVSLVLCLCFYSNTFAAVYHCIFLHRLWLPPPYLSSLPLIGPLLLSKITSLLHAHHLPPCVYAYVLLNLDSTKEKKCYRLFFFSWLLCGFPLGTSLLPYKPSALMS